MPKNLSIVVQGGEDPMDALVAAMRAPLSR